MGQRHNRRRTRPRSRNRSLTTIESPVQLDSLSDYAVSLTTSPNSSPLSSPLSKSIACVQREPFPLPSAPTWHQGYTAWQTRERKLQLEAEQCRLFGGEPGDDVSLCYRMLEYFGGLDYIDSLRDGYLGD